MSVKRSTAGKPAKQNRPRTSASGTDWERLRAMNDADALRSARRDRDNPPAEASWLEAGHLVEPVRKRAISLRLDPDIIDWFRDTGPRYQSRMNAVLRAFVQHRRRAGAPATKKASANRSRGG